MAFLSVAGAFVGSMGWYLIPFVVILSVVVFFHELGHYLVGRWCGVKIERFSLGFGPELYARVDRRGTRWRVAAIPLGGYVKFHGDADAASAPDTAALARMDRSERSLTLAGQPVLNRAAIVAAGPIANFLLAIVIFTVSFAVYGQYVLAPRVGGVEIGSPADLAGFKAGDLIKSANGGPIGSFEQLHEAISANTGLPMAFVVERAGAPVTITAAPAIGVVDLAAFGKRRMGRLGIKASSDPADRKLETCSLPLCVVWAAKDTWSIVHTTGAYVVGLFAGRESPDQVSGMIGVAQVAGAVAKISLLALFSLTAVFSVSVGLMNLLPVPMLDGGHLLFYAIEAVRGRPLSERTQEIGLRIGIALVAMLVIFSTSLDIMRLVAGGGG
ncbi:MAG: M50 family metallopeptidase [Roseiarcus sp.]